MKGQDRYLHKIGHSWYYRRKCPKDMKGMDPRFPLVTKALGTRDLMVARQRRNGFALADERLWEAFRAGADERVALDRYEADVQVAYPSGLSDRSGKPFDLSEDQELKAATSKIIALAKQQSAKPLHEQTASEVGELVSRWDVQLMSSAASGSNLSPDTGVAEAFQIYVNEIAVDERQSLNQEQDRVWLNTRRRAVKNFIDVIGDKPILGISREEAVRFHGWWLDRVQPRPGNTRGSVGPDTADKDMRNMRMLCSRYAAYAGAHEFRNPFDGLKFGKRPVKRPAFTSAQIAKFLQADALANLNEEARHIFLVCLCTGARVSEIINLAPSQILLKGDLPYIEIDKIDHGEHKHAIKADTSKRSIPLVGLAYEIMRLNPDGFPRYRGKSNTFSQTVMKHLKVNRLIEDDQKIFSLRHAWEDRAKQAKIADGLRRQILGHRVPGNQPDFEKGYSLQSKAVALKKIELPYDPAIV